MRKAAALTVICLIFGGCGSIHIKDRSEVHFYIDENQVASGDPQADALSDFIKKIRKMQNQEDKMEGFTWDEEMITKKKKAITEEEDWR